MLRAPRAAIQGKGAERHAVEGRVESEGGARRVVELTRGPRVVHSAGDAHEAHRGRARRAEGRAGPELEAEVVPGGVVRPLAHLPQSSSSLKRHEVPPPPPPPRPARTQRRSTKSIENIEK